MNIRDLNYVVAIAELEHFGKAADRCFVSQPTLSGQVKKLEEELGVKLFERNNRRVMPTEAGIAVVEVAKRILCDVKVIEEIAQSAQEPLGGRFKLGAFPTLATYLFPQLVQQVDRNMPELKLILVEEKTAELIAKLKSGDIDAALLALPLEDDALVSETLFEDEFLLAVPLDHELRNCKQISLALLAKYRLLLLEEGHCLRDQALSLCHLHNSAEDQEFKATSLETLRQMVKIGTGITLMPELATHGDKSNIHYIRFKSPAPKRTIALVWRKTYSRKQIIEKMIEILSVV